MLAHGYTGYVEYAFTLLFADPFVNELDHGKCLDLQHFGFFRGWSRRIIWSIWPLQFLSPIKLNLWRKWTTLFILQHPSKIYPWDICWTGAGRSARGGFWKCWKRMVMFPPFLRCLECNWARCFEAAVLISVNPVQVDPSRMSISIERIDIVNYNVAIRLQYVYVYIFYTKAKCVIYSLNI